MMFHNQRLPVRFFLLFAVLMSFSLTAPVAMAAPPDAGTCACMCVEGKGEDVCTASGFIRPIATPGGCANACA